jgi:predicted phosphoribosyltransferase
MIQQNVDYAKQYLLEEGFDVAKETEYAEQFLKKIRFHAQAISNKRNDLQLFEVAYNHLKQAIKENSEKTIQMLLPLLQSKAPAVHYRKLDKWTDDEIREVLADIDLVKLMEELSRDK